MSKQAIEMEINGEAVVFDVDLQTHNTYINSMTAINKVQPAHNFLMATCRPEKKDFIKEIITGDGGGFIAMQIAGHIDDAYTPKVQITVKKS